MKKKTLKELTLKDNFMFGAVMSDEENCRRLLELILRFPIERVEVSKEKSIVYHPEYKGIRLDVFAKDENNTRYNVEMQALNQYVLGKRSRYYHSQIDMELLLSGTEYSELPNAYVIFICNFDPFHKEKYCYTFENRCLELPCLNLSDGSKTIFLNTQGKNDKEVGEPLVKFLKYVGADLEESTGDFGDEFVEILQNSVKNVKISRRMEEQYMIFQEMLKEERTEGRAEGRAESVIELLADVGIVDSKLHQRIMCETNLDLLKQWHKSAAKATSIEQFLEDNLIEI